MLAAASFDSVRSEESKQDMMGIYGIWDVIGDMYI